MNKHKSNKIKENSNTVRHLIMGQITNTQNLVAIKEVRHAGQSPKVVALFSATNFSSYIIGLLQLHDTIQIKYNHAWIHYNIAIKSHLMI